jgi:hypothetical protein
LTTQEAGKQGIGSGVARATSLANGEKVSYETIKRMAAFFSRHEKNKAGGEDDAGKFPGIYGAETLVGHGPMASLGWWKVASPTNERICTRD